MKTDLVLWLKADLFLQKETFEELRNLYKGSEISKLNMYDLIDYSEEDDCITINKIGCGTTEIKDSSTHNLLNSGYVLMSIDSLRNFLSL